MKVIRGIDLSSKDENGFEEFEGADEACDEFEGSDEACDELAFGQGNTCLQLAKTSLCNGACTVGTKKARLQTERVQHNGSLQVQMKTSTMRLFLQRSR